MPIGGCSRWRERGGGGGGRRETHRNENNFKRISKLAAVFCIHFLFLCFCFSQLKTACWLYFSNGLVTVVTLMKLNTYAKYLHIVLRHLYGERSITRNLKLEDKDQPNHISRGNINASKPWCAHFLVALARLEGSSALQAARDI